MRAVLLLPFFQQLVIPTFGLNDFTIMRILVDLHLPSFALSRFLRSRSRGTSSSLRIKQAVLPLYLIERYLEEATLVEALPGLQKVKVLLRAPSS